MYADIPRIMHSLAAGIMWGRWLDIVLLQIACLMFFIKNVKNFHMAKIFTLDMLFKLFECPCADWHRRQYNIITLKLIINN